jgi:hypothetical protein
VSTIQKNQVGYCRPPKEHQFKPGVCPNPRGRGKKKPLQLSDDFQRVLSEPADYRDGERVKRAPRVDVAIKNLAARAMRGDIRAATLLLDLRKFFVECTDTGPIVLLVSGGLPSSEEGEDESRPQADHSDTLVPLPLFRETSNDA